jgi:hypothetical protein
MRLKCFQVSLADWSPLQRHPNTLLPGSARYWRRNAYFNREGKDTYHPSDGCWARRGGARSAGCLVRGKRRGKPLSHEFVFLLIPL